MEGAMNGRLIVRALSMLLFVLALAGLGYGRPALAQTAQPAASPAVADVRQIVTEARKEIESYTTAGGAAGAAGHPAIKWHAALWEVHERSPQSEAGAMAAAEAIRLLSRAGLWDRAHERVDQSGGAARPGPRAAPSGRQHGGDPHARSGAIRRAGYAVSGTSGGSHLRDRVPEHRTPGARDLREAAKRPPRRRSRRVSRQADRARLLGQYLSGLHGGGSSHKVARSEIRERGGDSRHQRRHQHRAGRPHGEREGHDLADSCGWQRVRRTDSEGLSHRRDADAVRAGSRRQG